MRIVSLLPAATEIVCGLGLRESLVGVSHECDYPSDVADLPHVTRTLIAEDLPSRDIDAGVRERLAEKQALYSLDRQTLRSLRPDLIVTQAICDVCAVAEDEVAEAARALPEPPQVINLQPTCLQDVLAGVQQVASAAGRRPEGEEYVAELRARIDAVARRTAEIRHRPSVLMLEWIDPPFNAGHWTPELVELAGGRDSLAEAGQRSVTIPWEKIVAADPEVLVIACCGFDVRRTLQDLPILRSYPGWESLRCVVNRQVFVVDGSAYFSRPGPRLVDSLEILAAALHPDVHPMPTGLTPAARVDPRRSVDRQVL